MGAVPFCAGGRRALNDAYRVRDVGSQSIFLNIIMWMHERALRLVLDPIRLFPIPRCPPAHRVTLRGFCDCPSEGAVWQERP